MLVACAQGLSWREEQTKVSKSRREKSDRYDVGSVCSVWSVQEQCGVGMSGPPRRARSGVIAAHFTSLQAMNATIAPHNVEQAVPFFWVRDLQASLRFYVDGLGFTRTTDWVDEGTLRWCWLELGGASVMLQQTPGRSRTGEAPGASPPPTVSVYFICKDALAIYRDLRSRGIVVKRPVVGNRMWVTGLADPDGNPIFFESATDVADETEYDG